MENVLKISREVAKAVKDAVSPIVGKDEANIVVGMGKDGTPTKKVDKVAEDVALDVLKNYDVKVVTEESGVVGDGNTIVALDPIDGTFNAVRGIPFYAVSLCFAKSITYDSTFFGYVYNLATEDEYYAYDSAFKNGKIIKCSKTENLEDTNAIFYYPYKKFNFKRIRILGAASLEICLVADGSVDCFIDIRKKGNNGLLRVYDVSAGMYIAEKAGAVVTSPDGGSIYNKKFTMEERFNLVIANNILHEKLIKVLQW